MPKGGEVTISATEGPAAPPSRVPLAGALSRRVGRIHQASGMSAQTAAPYAPRAARQPTSSMARCTSGAMA
jgi:hypothetical protein